MGKDKGLSSGSSESRSIAEERLRSENVAAGLSSPNEESQRLIHELQVHQIELEMQNEELRQARAEREEMETLLGKYSELYDFAPVGYFNLGHGGIIRAVNLTGAGFLGVERSLLIGRHLDNFISDETRPVFHDFLDKVFASESKEKCEVMFLQEKHSPLIVQIEAVVSESREECRAVVIDITGRKKTEEALLAAQSEAEKYGAEIKALMDAAPVAVLIAHDTECRHLSGSRATQELLGLPAAANSYKSALPSGRPTNFLIMKDGREIPSGQLPIHLAARGEEVRNYEFDLVYVCGAVRTFLGDAVPLFDKCGLPRGAIGAFIDITERKLAEEAQKKLNEELENRVAERTEELRKKDQMLLLQSRQAAMGEMIGNIAHQWRQPLNALGLTVQQLLLLYDLGEFNRELLDKSVLRSMGLIKHMSRTIDDFRNYFRPDKEKVEFKVSEAIANTVSLIEDSFKNQYIGIEVVAKHDPAVYGYRNEFAQALLNILNNARDALTERQINNPRVTITICSEDGCAVVIISDNAGGIPEEIIGKIFDPYFTTKGPQAGTGVGLFMSKTIIEKNMGGRLSVCNIADGAEFRIEV